MRYEKPVNIQRLWKNLGRRISRAWHKSPAITAALGVAAVCAVIAVGLVIGGRHTPGETGQYTQEDLENLQADDSYDASAGVLDATQFDGTILPEGEDAGQEYVDGTLFLGDSNTYRYMMYADEETGEAFTSIDNNIGVVSMGAGAITSLKCEKFKGDSKSYTMPEAVAMLKPQRVIICFGTNNLYGTSTDATNFIESYSEGLAAIHEAWPYADIIVSSIPPLDKQRSNSNLHQSQIDAYNLAIAEMCEEEGYYYLNTAETLKDPVTGWAKEDYTLSDGVHLSKVAVTAFFQYVRTHPCTNPDTRPKPLGTIPQPDGVIPGLISSDPIAVRNPGGSSETLYPVDVGVSGQGTAAASVTSAKVGDTISLSAAPSAGWLFGSWSCNIGSVSGGANGSITMPQGVDANGLYVVANFVECTDHSWTTESGHDQYVCSKCGLEGDTIQTAPPTPTPTPKPTQAPATQAPATQAPATPAPATPAPATPAPATPAPATPAPATEPPAATQPPATEPTQAPVEPPVTEPTQAPVETPAEVVNPEPSVETEASQPQQPESVETVSESQPVQEPAALQTETAP